MKILCIVGQTALGKTDLGLRLAKKFNGELIACDSRQVYKKLDIGTGKLPYWTSNVRKRPGFWEIQGIKIWMYDVVSLNKFYSVANFVKLARPILEDITNRGKLPIVVGGSGLYLRGLLGGIETLNIRVNVKLRRKLDKLSVSQLQSRLKKISPGKFARMNQSDVNNPRRLIRAIEVSGLYPYAKTKNQIGIMVMDILKIGLTAPREIVNRRIDKRVTSRIKQGLIDEAKTLYKSGLSIRKMKRLGLEYGCLADHLVGKLTNDQLVHQLKTKIHQFARRQLTWFRKDNSINWFDIKEKKWQVKVENKVWAWYNSQHGSKN